MLNQVTLCGRLGKDPESRATQTGTSVCNFSLATTKKVKDSSGQYVDKTAWHNCVAFGKTADNCAMYLRKGHQCLVEGEIEYSDYVGKDGNKVYVTKIICSRVHFLEKRPLDQALDSVGAQRANSGPHKGNPNPLAGDNSAYGGHNYTAPYATQSAKEASLYNQPKDQMFDPNEIPF